MKKADVNTFFHVCKDEWKSWLLPLCLTVSSVSNFVFFYLGLAMEENAGREYGFILIAVLFATGSLLSFLALLKERRIPITRLLLLATALLYFIVCYIIRFTNFGFAGDFTAYAGRFAVLCIPPLLCGVCSAVWHTEGAFLAKLEQMTVFVVPAAVFYSLSALFHCNPFHSGADLGIIHYMSFAYTIMPFLLAHIIRFCDNDPFWLPVRRKNSNHPGFIRIALIALYWYAILASGTRGCYVCITLFCVMMLLSRMVRRQKIMRTVILTGCLLAFMAASVMGLRLPGLERTARAGMVIQNAAEGKIVTSTDDLGFYENNLKALVQQPGGRQIANIQKDGDNGQRNPENPVIKNRGTLWKLAFLETEKAPLTGMAPGGFLIKYGSYPHNAVLELLCETGIIGTIILLVLFIRALIPVLRESAKWRETRYIALMLFAYAVRACFSSTAWECPALMLLLGYGLSLSMKKGRDNSGEDGKTEQLV